MDIVIVCVFAWALAQTIKVLLRYRQVRKWDLHLLWGSGGFPSAHSAFITCLMIQIGFVEGFRTSLFALALGTWAIVIYDSFNVRYAVGIQAQALNKLREELKNELHEPIEPLKEILGHTPTQVVAGIFLGAFIALLRIYIFPMYL